jgi:hypothetical protein
MDSLRAYITDTKLTFSYKMVVILVLLQNADKDGKTSKSTLIREFRQFYKYRQEHGLVVEKEREINPTPLLHPDDVTDSAIWDILRRYPLELMSGYLSIGVDAVQFKPIVWKQLSDTDVLELKNLCLDRLETYYADIR